ncbi:glycoside hydrolase family 31 protein [Clostridium sp. Cult3]|uniref:glycoside hydrolase family 31 protein n=1 Tax=Clostridium sp. Cult3 TaxID=2079004 RepID=UPI001F19E7BB|nr:TIM-barrel domain-containing protein [Clostridium sp. Cult3]MCF6460814.1 alpha-glucosidase [Clostridium sp. Cult3]
MKTYKLKNDTKIFEYGHPIETGAVVEAKIKTKLEEDLYIRFEEGHAKISLKLLPEDVVFGLGGNLGGINKRGRLYESYCTDEPLHIEDRAKLYAAHNFFIISGEEARGYFIDFPSRIKYDVGYYDKNYLNIEICGQDFYIYIIEGKDAEEVSRKFLEIIGRSYIPPKWAFGYFQSRWGYKDKDEVRKVYENFRENDIPLEGIFLDLDYMEDFKDFTISDEKFSGFKEFVEDLKRDGLYLVPIIDAGVKVEKGYHIYEEGIAGDHFCKDEEGKPYEGVVWPGKVHFPDFMKEETQLWFGSKYKILTDCGIEGFWNDMNEPAIFYEPKALDAAIQYAQEQKGKDLDVFSYFELKDNFTNLANKDSYYKNFYHEIDGKRFSNDEVHNLYGYYMTKSANLGLTRLLKDKRFLLISRASSIGMHRYGGIWTGDNSSWWSHLEQNIKMLPSLNMCGFFYIGADTGGFGGNCNGELLTRWLQLSIFTPLLRNHSAIGCNNQEPYVFTEEVLENTRNLIKARYSLIPYIYSEYMKAVNNYTLMFKPLSFEFQGTLAEEAEDQILLGDQLMLAPVYDSNRRGRYVYFPEEMLEVSFLEEDMTTTIRKKGIYYIEYGLEDLKFFLRKNSILPYVKPSKNVKELDLKNIEILAYVDDEAIYELYDDDGKSYDSSYSTNINIVKKTEDYDVKVDNDNPSIENINIKIIDSKNNIKHKEILIRGE